LVDSAVEEFARFASPVQVTSRVLHAEVELGGKRLGAGQHVDLVLGSANRDPAVFSDPERLRVARNTEKHLAYGAGSHYCLGVALARLEVSAALRALLARSTSPRLAGMPVWRESMVLRGPISLPVELG
jgi:cytochrome P450